MSQEFRFSRKNKNKNNQQSAFISTMNSIKKLGINQTKINNLQKQIKNKLNNTSKMNDIIVRIMNDGDFEVVDETETTVFSETNTNTSTDDNDFTKQSEGLSATSTDDNDISKQSEELSATSVVKSDSSEQSEGLNATSTDDNNYLQQNDNWNFNGGASISHDYDDYSEQTYLLDSDDDDDDKEESLITRAKNLKSKKYLSQLNVNELRNIMRQNNMQLSKNGAYLRKDVMIKTIQKNK